MDGDISLTSKLKNETIAGHVIGIYDSGPVGILVSGGADSAILLYTLMKYISNNTIHIYTTINTIIIKEQEPAFDNVISTCSRLTGNTNFVIHKRVADIEFDGSADYFKMCNDAIDSREIDILYKGVTVFPDHEIWKDWETGLDFQENYDMRPPGVIQSFWGIQGTFDDVTYTIGNRLYKPWVNKNKQDIAAIYRELGVEKELYPVSRSCETYPPEGQHCGRCWWCRERIWGFGYLQ
jgi:hypothetical protein